MKRVGYLLVTSGVLLALFWGLSQVGGEPRFSRVEAVPQVGTPVNGVVRTDWEGNGNPQLPSDEEQPLRPETINSGPTMGPPPSGSHLPNAGKTRDVALPHGTSPHVSRFASTGAAKWTRIHQILVDAGENNLAQDIASYQDLLRDSRRGGEASSLELIEEQNALVVQVSQILTGDEVDKLLQELEAAADAMNAAEEEASEDELEGEEQAAE